jgi:hypothetical protein
MAHDILIEDRDVVEALEQVEGDVRLPVGGGAADVAQVVVDAERLHLVPHGAERRNHVVLGPPRLGHDIGAVRDGIGRDQVPVDEREDAQLAHNATRCRPLCR